MLLELVPWLLQLKQREAVHILLYKITSYSCWFQVPSLHVCVSADRNVEQVAGI